ncbi:arginine--tRNA ligase [Streptacidiphilus jiangxiensis]|uniref:Arginine--tRNA ligase n=1 Tax=Streptacidiphilus jiangxiensis TaxID=235985 RepID=A0A1H7JZ11_STRJI|nr:arginine--tRNA ligase [Streptacidiphilus jiangxiensis]SEK79380.1 arginyl-tRNA synthetase [Streptacidiphilus jiangxiensis]
MTLTAHTVVHTPVEPLAVVVERRVAGLLGGAEALLRRSGRADFQANGVLPLAKVRGKNPAALAAEVAARLAGVAPVAHCVASGPGFLNIDIDDAALLRNLAARAADPRLGVARTATPGVTVVDYSSPNIAKEMHVGHLRTTVIGDALTRIFDFTGETVIRRNHLGDWGTGFGMLIEQLFDESGEGGEVPDDVAALSATYQRARACFDADAGFAERARLRVVALQAGDERTLAVWWRLVEVSQVHFQQVYAELGVLLEEADAVGESHYNPMLPQVCAELEAAGIAVESQGALCVFPEGDEGAPLIVRKGDGGYGYAVTDLAAVRDRVGTLGARRLLYLVDARQARHFAQVFDTARRAGWLPEGVTARHLPFGMVLGSDGRPFKTRSGDTVRLQDLLDQATEKATAIVAAKNPGLTGEELRTRARQVGVGALKYADLSNNRIKDYVFDPDRMLSLTGDTATYLQYAHARMRSVLRKAGEAGAVFEGAELAPAERALGLVLDEFGGAVAAAAETCEPHRLCAYLHALATAFSAFWEHCPVLKAEDERVRRNRLLLCALSARTLELGMGLLGIEAPSEL